MLSNAPVTAVVPCSDLERAKKFYEGKLGLKAVFDMKEHGTVYGCGKGTTLLVYTTDAKGSAATAAAWTVEDIKSAVDDLKAKGVVFEEYDMPGIKTVDGIAENDGMKSAWFKDPDGNILNIDQAA